LYLNESEDAPLKIADFGLSKMLYGDDNTATVCGTPGYCGKFKLPIYLHAVWANSLKLWALTHAHTISTHFFVLSM